MTAARFALAIRRSLGIAGVLTASALVWAVAGAAAIAAAPTAITGPVSAVGPSSATVSGTVNPGGQATSWYVEYGTGTSYGSQSASSSAGSGSANVAVSRGLSGLSSGTTYHYRVVATNGAGTSRGADGIFTTSAAPAAVTGAATAVTPTSATINGTVDPNGRATTWYFEYGTSTSYGTKTPVKDAGAGGSSVVVSAALTNLARGRTYHFRLVASSDAGTSRGADQTFSTFGAPGVTTDTATSVTPTSARLNGTITPNGQATNWFFDYGTSTSYGARTPVRGAGSGTGSTPVNASVTRLRTGVTYHYRLVAINASGTTVGRDRTFSTNLQPVVRTDAARDATATTATVTGSVDPRTRSTNWWFEYGTTTGYGSQTASRSAGSGGSARAVSAGLSGLRPGTTYHYRLVARNDAGTTRGADLTFATLGVTLTIPAQRVVYGRGILLSGLVPTRRAGETVIIFAQPLDNGSPRSVATVLTAADGSWRWLARPRIRTSYAAQWAGVLSPASVVGVRPAISLRRTATGFSTRVVAARSFAGRGVQLQRRTAAGRWVTVKRVRLNGRSAALIKVTLPRGRSVLRVAMSVNQAGVGYLAGFSRTIVYRRS